MDQAIPQSVLYTVIAALCGTIVFLFRLSQTQAAKTLELSREADRSALEIVAKHHDQAVARFQEERTEHAKDKTELREAMARLTQATEENAKACAQVVLAMLFLPKEFKAVSEKIITNLEVK